MLQPLESRVLTALAARLQPVLPAEFSAVLDGGVLRLRREGVPFLLGGTDLAAMLRDDSARRIASAVALVLGDVQDVLAEDLATPWPAASHNMPMPFCQVRGDVLHLGYGDPDSPALLLPAIPLTTVLQASDGGQGDGTH